MTDVDEAWRRRSDERLIEAAGRLEEYTDEGRRVIQAELERRGLEAPLPRSHVRLQTVDYSADYSSVLRRAHWTTVLLMFSAAVNLVAVGSSASQVFLVRRMVAGEFIIDATLTANDTRQELLGALKVIALVVTAVAFLRWLSRSYKNLPAFGVTPSFTPAWAIGAWFVPLLNFVRPYQIVKELWVMNQPTQDSALVGWWWAAWIIWGFIGRALFGLTRGAEQLSEILNASYLNLISDAVGVIGSILAMYVVRGITRRQDDARRTMLTNLVGV